MADQKPYPQTGVIDVMQSALDREGQREQDQSAVLKPPDSTEAERIAVLREMYERAMRAREAWESTWKTVYEFVMGKQWETAPAWKATPVENYMFSTLTGMLASMVYTRPTMHIVPQKSDVPMEYVKVIRAQVDKIWAETDMDRKIEAACTNCLMFSKGFLYTYWDPIEQTVCTESVDPTNIFVNDDATSLIDATYLIHVTRMPIWDVLRRWPDAKGKIAAGTRTTEEGDDWKDDVKVDETSSVRAGFQLKDGGVSANVVPYVSDDVDPDDAEDDFVQVLQFWIRDPETELISLTDEATGLPISDEQGKMIKVRRPKYPGGRHVILAGSRIVHDAPNPFWHQEFPYVEIPCYVVPGEFWGISAMQNLVSPQRELNKTMGQIIDNKNLMGNLPWLYDTNSGVDPSMLTAQPGIAIPRNPGTVIERIAAPPLPNYIVDVYYSCRRAIDDISGHTDTTQGRRPTGIQSGVAIERLQNAAQTKMRLPINHMEQAIESLGEQWLALLRQYVKSNRVVRIVDEQTGQYQFLELTPKMVQQGYDLLVVEGSTLPKNREFLHQQAVELYQLGLIDKEAALKYIEFPEADEVLRRLQEAQVMQTQLALQAQAATGNAPGGPAAPRPPQGPPMGGGMPNAAPAG